MLRPLAGRLVFALLLPALAFVGAFLLTALAPGDPLAGRGDIVSSQALEAERRQLGLDRPVMHRLASRMIGLAQLDLGRSLKYGRPVRMLLVERVGSTLRAGGTALLVALLVGIPAGVLVAERRSGVLRHLVSAMSLTVLSVPALVLALLLTTVGDLTPLPPFLIMTLALALPAAALLERAQARALQEVLPDTALRAAQARGVPRLMVTWRHAWPLSLPAVLGIASIIASQLLSGALAIELVTARSGLGLLTYEALLVRDTDLAAGCAAAAALLVGLVTLTADALHLWLDPRARVDVGARLARPASDLSLR